MFKMPVASGIILKVPEASKKSPLEFILKCKWRLKPYQTFQECLKNARDL